MNFYQKDNAALELPGNTSEHFATLDGLRGIAAIAVMILHIYHAMKLGDRFPHAYLAVDFFFLLSGFVVAKAYEARLSGKMMSVSEFIKTRFVRLYPMIFVGVILGAAVLGIHLLQLHTISIRQFLVAVFSALLLLPTTALNSIYPELVYPINQPEWSLFFEIIINCLYVIIIGRLNLFLLGGIVLFSCVALLVVAMQHQGLDVGANSQNFLLGFVRVTFAFFLGVLLLRYRIHYILDANVCFCLMAALAAILLIPYYKETWIYDFISAALIFPGIVFVGSICKTGPIVRTICLWLGEISYPLYITHQPIVRIVVNALTILHLTLPHLIVALICSFVSVSVAGILFVIWDRPIRSFLSKIMLKPSPLRPIVPVSN